MNDRFGQPRIAPEIRVERVRTPEPPGWFIFEGSMCRCDRMHELSVWKHKIKRAYLWYQVVEAVKHRRWDYWNEGL